MTQSDEELFHQHNPRVPIRGVHLDLKGLPPTPRRLLELLKIIHAGRYNMILVEWEDMFPWTVDERFRSPTAYTPAHVKHLANAAGELGIEIIPLVQCLGHMETVLSIDDYAHMREVPDRMDVLNPLADGASDLIRRMIDDVTRLLPGLRYFHIGGDEAWTFGTHPQTAEYVKQHGKAHLYMRHIQPLLDHLNGKMIHPILWHDMMIEWDPSALRKLGEQADLMAWGYGPTPERTEHHYAVRHIDHLHQSGVPLWGATAYKGADGMTADLPNLVQRRENASGWMRVADRFNFKGVVATAWSRYATHLPQCEPIDGALDAMLLVGAILHDGDAPPDRRAACLNVLKQLNEADRFNAAYQALGRLRDIRLEAWHRVQLLREKSALSAHDPSRSGGSIMSPPAAFLDTAITQWPQTADDLRAALKDAISPRWVEEYLTVRWQAIQSERTDLT